jgi:MFS family permease
MSSTILEGAGADPGGFPMGPLEQLHSERANFRNASQDDVITKTHWHIAFANGLGWGFDGMDGVIFALAAPLFMVDFNVGIPELRSGSQISLMASVVGIYFWPWLADKMGRRTLLAINIAMFSFFMPVAAWAPTWTTFIIARMLLNFALSGEWALGSMLVAETWPARLRGRVLSINRGTWCLGASLAGVISTYVIAVYGWRWGMTVPVVISLLAIYVRGTCPESPYWVRTQDRKRRIAQALAQGRVLSADDAAWNHKAKKLSYVQLFAPDMWKSTLVATFVACCSTCIFGTVGGWMPLYLKTEMGWSVAEYSTFYIAWGVVGSLGLITSGILADMIGRRPAFVIMLIEGAIFITLWVFTKDRTLLWVFGLLWSIGFLGFWGPSNTLTAEIFPTRIRGSGNGFCWSVAWVVGFILWPFATVAMQQATGSFAAAFLAIPIFMIGMAIGVWMMVPEYAGKELNEISV